MTAILDHIKPKARLAVVVATAVALAAGVGLPRLTAQATPGVNNLSIADAANSEGTGGTRNLDFVVTLSPVSPTPVTVDFTVSPGSAKLGSDYTEPTNHTVTFPAASGSQTISIPMITDAAGEPDETLTVSLTNEQNASVTRRTATGTIQNDDGAAPRITVADVTTAEPAGPTDIANFKVRLDQPAPQAISVEAATADQSAVAPGDYVAKTETLTFNTGEQEKNFNVTVNGDSIDEADNELFTVNLSNPINAQIQSGQAAGNITDDDAAPVVNIDGASANELSDGATAVLTMPVTLTGNATERTVTVSYATANGSGPTGATAGSDYTSAVGSLTFPPGTTTRNLAVTILGDNLDEPDETFTATLSSPSNATLNPAKTTGTGTIVDNDATPSVSSNDVTVTEGNSGTTAAVFTVTLSGTSGNTVTVNYATADGSASAPADYTAQTGTLSFPPGTSTRTVTVPVVGDTLDEVNETFNLVLSNVTGGAVLATGADGVGNITDDDAPPTIAAADVAVTEGNSGLTPLTFQVKLSTASGQSVSVTASTASNTAIAGQDFASKTQQLTFSPGETTKDFVVNVLGDTLDEANESFFVNLTAATGGTVSDAQAVGTITDDDDGPVLSISDAAITEGNSGTKLLQFTVTKTGTTSQSINVNWATSDDSAVSTGTAALGSQDYVAGSGVVTIPAASQSGTFNVTINGDALAEPDERFFVTLSAPTNSTLSPTASRAQGQILNDDGTTGIPTVAISDGSATTEGNTGTTPMTFTVTVTGTISQNVTVNYATQDGTAKAPGDYTAKTGTLTFTPTAATPQTITVDIVGDVTDEANETLFVKITSVGNGNASDDSGTGTITDNDAPPTLSVLDAAAPEGNTGTVNKDVEIQLSAASGQEVTVKYATSDGTATAGSDYGAVAPTVVTFAPGELSKMVQVPVNGDTADEANETVIVTLSEPTNATIADGSGVLTINDDDETASALAIGDGTLDEADGNMTFTVTLTPASSGAVTVKYSTADGTATSPADFTAIAPPATLSFGAGETTKTIDVAIKEDTVDEADETFVVNLTEPGNATISDGSGTGTITDDDTAPTVSVNDVTAPEGGQAAFTVSLSAASGQDVTVKANTADGTATEPGDYTKLTDQTVTIPAGQTSVTLNVATVGDTNDEPNETFTVALSAPTNATVGDGSGTATITDDDDPPPNPPAISISDAVAVEGNAGTTNLSFDVTLDKAGTSDVTVHYATTDGTATAPSDYDAKADDITFVAGDTTETILIVVKGDTDVEPNETLSVVLSSPTGATIADGTGAGQITNDDGPPPTTAEITTGVGPGGGSHVRSFRGSNPTAVNFFAFNQAGGVRVARGDLDGDGIDEIIAVGGPGGRPVVAVYNATGGFIAEFLAYADGFRGGVSVAAGDVDGDGVDEIITGAGQGGGPHVRVFGFDDNGILFLKDGFYGADNGFGGGVNVAAADLDADNKAEIVTAHASGPPIVRTFRYTLTTNAIVTFASPFLAYAEGFTGGVNVAAGHLDTDGRAEIVTGPVGQGGPHIRIFNGQGGVINNGIMAYAGSFSGGVSVAVGDLNGDGNGEIVTGAGPGGDPHVRVFKGDLTLFAPEVSFYAYPNWHGGAFVAVGQG